MKSASLGGRDASLLLIFGIVGLGNIWRFPALVTQYGGGAFLLVYVLAVLTVAAPLLIAELKLGKLSGTDSMHAIGQLAQELRLSRLWGWMPWFWLVAAVALLSLYGVLAGWSLGYVLRAASGQTAALDAITAEALFLDFATNPEKVLAWYTIFWVIIAVASAHGLRGVLRAARLLLGLSLGTVLWLAVEAFGQGDSRLLVQRLLQPHWHQLGWEGVLQALAHACYSLSIGLGMVYTVGRHLRAEVPLLPLAFVVVLVDTLAGLLLAAILLAGLPAAMPLGEGARLLFVQYPMQLAGAGQAPLTAVGLYGLASLFSAGSALLLMESVVNTLQSMSGLSRSSAAGATALLLWLLGLLSLLSLAGSSAPQLVDSVWVDWLRSLAVHWLLPLNLLALAWFVSRVLPASLLGAVHQGSMAGLVAWYGALRHLAGLGAFAMFVYVSGLGQQLMEFWSKG